MPFTKTEIFSTPASQYFANRIANIIGLPTRGIERKRFRNGERYYRLELANRTDLIGKNVIYVASTHTDEDINELYRVGCALAAYGTQQRIFVIPYFGYSTMERAVMPGEIVTAKTIARQLSLIPNTRMGNTFLFLDLHASGIVHYFEGECLRFELYAQPALLTGIRKMLAGRDLANVVFASADLGRPKWVNTFAQCFNTGIALINKGRDGESTRVLNVIGDVRGKTVVIYDDMIRNATTLINASDAYLNEGAAEVLGVTSHAALSDENVIDAIQKSSIKKIVTTNSHPITQSGRFSIADKFLVQDCSDIFSTEIKKLLI